MHIYLKNNWSIAPHFTPIRFETGLCRAHLNKKKKKTGGDMRSVPHPKTHIYNSNLQLTKCTRARCRATTLIETNVLTTTPRLNPLDSKQEYVLLNAVSVPLLQFARYCSIVQTLSLKYIWVATLTLRLHDVVGHLITLLAIFYFLYVLYWKRHVGYIFNNFVAIGT